MVKTNLTLTVISGKQDKAKSVTLPKEIFNITASNKLLSQYVYVYLNNLKKGKHQTKTRSQVKGSTRKIYKQKGTGRARHGDVKAPIFVGGGIAFGPTGEHRKLKLTKKMRRKALFYTLTSKLKENNLALISDGMVNKIKKTKEALSLFTKLKLPENASLVLPHQDKTTIFFNNLDSVNVHEPASLNAYRVLKAGKLVFTEKSLAEFIAIFKHE